MISRRYVAIQSTAMWVTSTAVAFALDTIKPADIVPWWTLGAVFWWVVIGHHTVKLGLALLFAAAMQIFYVHVVATRFEKSAPTFGKSELDTKPSTRTEHLTTGESGIVVGAMGDTVLRDTGDGHVMVVGPSRRGKGRGYVMPTALEWPGSAIIMDWKREIFDETSEYRASLGPVYHLDMNNAASAYNPLTQPAFDSDAALALAETIVSGQKSSDQFWTNTAKLVLQAVIMHVVETAKVPSMYQVQDAVLNLDQTIAHASPSARGMLKALPADYKKSDLKGSIVWTIIAALGAFQQRAAAATLSAGSDFDAEDLMCGERPATVYISANINDLDVLRPLVRVLLVSLLRPLLADLNFAGGMEKRHKLLFLADEIAELNKMDIVERLHRLGAGYGIRCMSIWQSLDQINLYGRESALMDNVGTGVFFSSLNGESLERLSKAMGTTTEFRNDWIWMKIRQERTGPIFETARLAKYQGAIMRSRGITALVDHPFYDQTEPWCDRVGGINLTKAVPPASMAPQPTHSVGF